MIQYETLQQRYSAFDRICTVLCSPRPLLAEQQCFFPCSHFALCLNQSKGVNCEASQEPRTHEAEARSCFKPQATHKEQLANYLLQMAPLTTSLVFLFFAFVCFAFVAAGIFFQKSGIFRGDPWEQQRTTHEFKANLLWDCPTPHISQVGNS